MELSNIQIAVAVLVAVSVGVLNLMKAWKLWKDIQSDPDDKGPK